MAAVEGLTKIPELRRRILFTLGVLAVYRFGSHIPLPGIDPEQLKQFLGGKESTLFSMFNMFTGRAMEHASVFALGVMPYISASIIFQLLTVVVPQLHAINKEGDSGRKKINQYTRYATVAIAIVQGTGLLTLVDATVAGRQLFNVIPYKVVTIIALTSGTMFLMWLGEQISERGIGNGISLIIYAGIGSGIPTAVSQTYRMVKDGQLTPLMLVILVAFMILTVAVIIFLETGQRRVPIHHAKRMVGKRLYGGQTQHLPLKINSSGVMPPIFASSLLTAPITILSYAPASWTWAGSIRDALQRGGVLYFLLYTSLIVFFAFFYTSVVFNTQDMAENLKKSGAYVPGIRPGRNTQDYFDRVLMRLTVGGAIYLALVCLLPDFVSSKFKVSFYFGGTTLLILVGVALDTVSQVQTFLLTRDYEGFMKNAKLRGRRG